MNARLTTTVASLAVSALLLAGCTNGTTPETPSPEPTAVTTTSAAPSPIPTTETPTPEPSPTPTEADWFPDQPTDETDVQTDVREGWEAYERVMDKYVRDPELNDLTEINHVTTGQESTDAVQLVVRIRQNNLKREGHVVFRNAVISEPTTNADGVTTAEVNYCFDPKDLRTVDATTGEPGESVIQPDQTMKIKVLMEKMPDGTWRAALSQTELTPC